MPGARPITEALLSAIAHSEQPMVLTDPNLQDHPMIAVNAAFEALTGYPAAETVGRNCRFLQGAETDAATPSRIGRCIAERRGCIEWIVNYRADGTKFWNVLFISPVFDRDGTLLHFFGNQRDITEGPPSDLPDYTLGKADMPRDQEMAFHDLLLDVFDDTRTLPSDIPSRAAALDRIVENTRRLNDVTTRLRPAPWSMPR